jgi:hypothetical protein
VNPDSDTVTRIHADTLAVQLEVAFGKAADEHRRRRREPGLGDLPQVSTCARSKPPDATNPADAASVGRPLSESAWPYLLLQAFARQALTRAVRGV